MKKLLNTLCSCVIMILMLISSNIHAQQLDKIVAIVNDGVITENELMTQVNLIRKQLQQRQVALPAMNVMQQQVLSHMIGVELELQLAKRANIVIENSDVDNGINKIATQNKLTLAQLRQMVAAQGLAWDKYRENIKKEMTIEKVQQQAVGHRIIITDQQVQDYLKNHPQTNTVDLSNTEFHLKDILIPLPEAPTDVQIQAAKQQAEKLLQQLQHGADFSNIAVAVSGGETALQGGDLGYRKLAALPEVFAHRVPTMKVGTVAGPIRTPNGFHLIKLIETKGTVLNRYITLTHVRHILIKTDAANAPTIVKEKLDKLRMLLLHGADFATIAEKNSQDPASAAKGGDLGWVHPGELMPTFEEAMNNLKINEISKPVKTQFGWHLIQVAGRKQIDDSKAFQQQQVKQMLYQRKFSEAAQNWLQQLRSRAYVKVLLPS